MIVWEPGSNHLGIYWLSFPLVLSFLCALSRFVVTVHFAFEPWLKYRYSFLRFPSCNLTFSFSSFWPSQPISSDSRIFLGPQMSCLDATVPLLGFFPRPRVGSVDPCCHELYVSHFCCFLSCLSFLKFFHSTGFSSSESPLWDPTRSMGHQCVDSFSRECAQSIHLSRGFLG